MQTKHKVLLAGAGALALLYGYPAVLQAADHLDGPAVQSDPAADITDVYTWMEDDTHLNVVLNLFPLADETSKFSTAIQYAVHINSSAGYGQPQTEKLLLCTFSEAQRITCQLDDAIIINNQDASSTSGVTGQGGDVKVFAGLRKDPFFFDLENFNLARTTVRDAAPSLTFDEAGCPELDNGTRAALVATVTGTEGGLEGTNVPGVNFFATLNVMSIVVQLDTSLLGPGPVYSVWASTHARP